MSCDEFVSLNFSNGVKVGIQILSPLHERKLLPLDLRSWYI